MRIGILEAGVPPGDLAGTFGHYDAMVARLIGDGFATRTFAVREGEFPDAPEACDAYVITGSSAGVYDPLPWIAPLAAFLRDAKGRARLVGICFGHQIMAEAFGGHAAKSEKGRGIGLHDYAVAARPPWMDEIDRFRIAASHGDQVVRQPPATSVVAESEFTPIAALAYHDQPAISFQGHPEFEPAFARALLERHRGRIDDARLDAAAASFDTPNDRERVAGWIRAFLHGSRPHGG